MEYETSLQGWARVLDNLPDAILVIDSRMNNGQILYLNAEATKIFGYERDELIGQCIDTLVPSHHRNTHLQHRGTFVKSSERRIMGAGRVLFGCRKDGTEFPADVHLSQLREDQLYVTIAIVRDMSSQRQLEHALILARDAAEKANKVKSRFLAAASHDLRQPLQTIWNLQSVLTRALGDSTCSPHLALLEEAVRDMDQILASLVDINRLEAGAIQPVIRDFSLQDLLARLRSAFTFAAASKSLTLDIQDCCETAHSDPMLLPLILRNLIGNAIKYTEHGTVLLRVRSDADSLYIDVIDTGSGIPPQHLERIFGAFYQLDNPTLDQRKGIGLGLSIVRTISRLLEHPVTVTSEVGKGSTFTVRLPRGATADHTPALAPAPKTNTPLPMFAPKVLHIEDDPGVARSMALLLRLEGYEVISAATRDEALQQIDILGLRPDLILTDYQLPLGFTGDEVVAEIQKLLHAKPPTIMLTGDIADKHVSKARLIADRLIPKPVNIDELLAEMTSLLSRQVK